MRVIKATSCKVWFVVEWNGWYLDSILTVVRMLQLKLTLFALFLNVSHKWSSIHFCCVLFAVSSVFAAREKFANVLCFIDIRHLIKKISVRVVTVVRVRRICAPLSFQAAFALTKLLKLTVFKVGKNRTISNLPKLLMEPNGNTRHGRRH